MKNRNKPYYEIIDLSNRINVPKPEVLIDIDVIDAVPGTTKQIFLNFNETNRYDLNTTIYLREDLDDMNVKLTVPRLNTTIVDGYGSIPIILSIPPETKPSSVTIPLRITYSVLSYKDEYSLFQTKQQSYSKEFLLPINVLYPTSIPSLINFNDIPREVYCYFCWCRFYFFYSLCCSAL